MISINATLFLQIAHFLILIFILNRIMFRPIMRIIKERDKHFEDEKRQLNNIEEETKELIDKCVSIERDARKKAGDDSSQLRQEANSIAEKIFGDAREEVAAIRMDTDGKIDDTLKKARQTLQSEAATLAEELVVKVIGRRVTN